MNGEQIVQMMPPPMMVVNPNQQIMQQQPQMHAHQGGPYHQMPQFQMQTQQGTRFFVKVSIELSTFTICTHFLLKFRNKCLKPRNQ